MQDYIRAERRRRRKKYLVTERRIMEEMARAAFSNPADFITQRESGDYGFDFKKLLGDDARALKGIRFGQGGDLELQFHNKIRALEFLRKVVADRGDDLDDVHKNRRVVLYLPSNEPKSEKKCTRK